MNHPSRNFRESPRVRLVREMNILCNSVFNEECLENPIPLLLPVFHVSYFSVYLISKLQIPKILHEKFDIGRSSNSDIKMEKHDDGFKLDFDHKEAFTGLFMKYISPMHIRHKNS